MRSIHSLVVARSGDADDPPQPVCTNCGAKVDRTDVICPQCGESLVGG